MTSRLCAALAGGVAVCRIGPHCMKMIGCWPSLRIGVAVSLGIPAQIDHPFRRKSSTDSGLIVHPAGGAAWFATLGRISKGTVCKILQAHELKPHKVNYYLERRDPEFERKMAEVLVVYKEVEMQQQGDTLDAPEVTISCDEKPGIQAIANIAPDLPPVPGCHRSLSRDYEYKRYGTVSLLAGVDLNSGHVFGIVRNRHRSREFIELLQEIHAHYPQAWKIRLILANHSSHLSKKTRAWLAEHPNRFVLIFTPTHGSWLNLVETLFSKMTRSFLRGLRVGSKQELISRIDQWIGEINADPLIPRWTYQPDANA